MRLLLTLTALLLLPSCHKKQEEHTNNTPELPTVSVKTILATLQNAPSHEPLVGTVRPRLEATISSDISGRILEFLVVSGQKVKKGDLIARIDAPELNASQLRAAAALQQAELELARQKRLIKKNATSRARYEQAIAAERMSHASLGQINASLAKANVKSPFTGTITRKHADAGDLASPGRPLAKIEDPSALRLEVPVAESLAGNLKLGDTIQVEIQALSLTIDGKIGELEPSADAASRTFLIKIDLPASQTIRAGLFGRALIPRGESSQILIPKSALVRRGQMEVLFVNANGHAELRLARTIPFGKKHLRVLSGILPNEHVIITPPATLRDGSPLTLLK